MQGTLPALVKCGMESGGLMGAGQDRAFRVFSVIQDQQSREVSQGHIAHRAKRMRVAQEDLKLPRVTGMDACQVLPSCPYLLLCIWS